MDEHKTFSELLEASLDFWKLTNTTIPFSGGDSLPEVFIYEKEIEK